LHSTADPIAFALLCASRAEAVAIVTLVAIEGTGPRQVGAQMCVSVAANGRAQAVGSFSGGCLDKAVIAEAQSALLTGKSRTLQFGTGSEFADLQLPCGSQLTLRIDAPLSATCLQQLSQLRQARAPYQWRWRDDQPLIQAIDAQSALDALCYFPNLVIHAAGSAAAMLSFCKLCIASDVVVIAHTPDAELRAELHSLSTCTNTEFNPTLDRYSAAITLFHEHEYELMFLQHALSQDALYTGAMGSAKAHARRIAVLLEHGVSQSQLSRLRGHIGLIAQARTPQLLAVSILAEIMQCYQQLIDQR
jgi:xanthine dehydrogenase accessory factor